MCRPQNIFQTNLKSKRARKRNEKHQRVSKASIHCCSVWAMLFYIFKQNLGWWASAVWQGSIIHGHESKHTVHLLIWDSTCMSHKSESIRNWKMFISNVSSLTTFFLPRSYAKWYLHSKPSSFSLLNIIFQIQESFSNLNMNVNEVQKSTCASNGLEYMPYSRLI